MAWFSCAIAFWLRFEGQVEPTHPFLAWVLPLVAIPGRLTMQTALG
jgi:hypothetical protein